MTASWRTVATLPATPERTRETGHMHDFQRPIRIGLCNAHEWGRHTIGQVTVAPVLDDVAEDVLDPLVAGKIEGVGWAGTQHGDVKAPEGPQQTLSADDAMQGLVDAAVLGLGVRLEALHARLGRWQGGKKKQGKIRSCICLTLPTLTPA